MGKKKATSPRKKVTKSKAEYSIERACEKAREQKWQAYNNVQQLRSDMQRANCESLFDELPQFHREVKASGGARLLYNADNETKLPLLRASQLLASDNNYVISTVRSLEPTDGAGNRLAPKKIPNQYFHAIMNGLCFPDGGRGPEKLLELAAVQHLGRRPLKERQWDDPVPLELQKKFQCDPLIWLLTQCSSLGIDNMATLLSGTNMTKSKIKKFLGLTHSDSKIPWPFMDVSGQVDVMSYLLSGVSKLVKWLGYNGLIIAFDLDALWPSEQSKAGKTELLVHEQCLGALIWAALAPEYNRTCTRNGDKINEFLCRHGSYLKHTGKENSPHAYPFTTRTRCNLGVVYSTTSRTSRQAKELQKFGPHNWMTRS